MVKSDLSTLIEFRNYVIYPNPVHLHPVLGIQYDTPRNIDSTNHYYREDDSPENHQDR